MKKSLIVVLAAGLFAAAACAQPPAPGPTRMGAALTQPAKAVHAKNKAAATTKVAKAGKKRAQKKPGHKRAAHKGAAHKVV